MMTPIPLTANQFLSALALVNWAQHWSLPFQLSVSTDGRTVQVFENGSIKEQP